MPWVGTLRLRLRLNALLGHPLHDQLPAHATLAAPQPPSIFASTLAAKEATPGSRPACGVV